MFYSCMDRLFHIDDLGICVPHRCVEEMSESGTERPVFGGRFTTQYAEASYSLVFLFSNLKFVYEDPFL